MTFGNEYSKGNRFLIPFGLMTLLRTEFLKELVLVHKSIAQLRTGHNFYKSVLNKDKDIKITPLLMGGVTFH